MQSVSVDNIPFRNIVRVVTALNVFIVDKSSVTLSLAWLDAIQTVVEPGAIRWVRVVGVKDGEPILVMADLLGALETIAEFLYKSKRTWLAILKCFHSENTYCRRW